MPIIRKVQQADFITSIDFNHSEIIILVNIHTEKLRYIIYRVLPASII